MLVNSDIFHSKGVRRQNRKYFCFVVCAIYLKLDGFIAICLATSDWILLDRFAVLWRVVRFLFYAAFFIVDQYSNIIKQNNITEYVDSKF